MSKDIRVEKNTDSLLALRDLLREVCSRPSDYLADENLKAALCSQGKLARYSNSDKSILGSSINTVKRIANQYLDGGFAAIDRLRVDASNALMQCSERRDASNKATKVGLARRVTQLEQEIVILKTTNYNLLVAISKAIDAVVSMDEDSAELRTHRREKSIKLISSIVALNPFPFDSPNTSGDGNVVEVQFGAEAK